MSLAKLKLRSEDFSASALKIISRKGATSEALSDIGAQLATFASGLKSLIGVQAEQILNVESDGTFELLLFSLLEHRPSYRDGLAFDTWSVHTPLTGSFEARLDGGAPVKILPGSSLEILPGVNAKLHAVEENVQICSLFGIARKHLPPARTAVT